ncbi:dienelactone hydrolase family-domain-containing protein [Glomus cerebriforme]|uniref:Dienelactone hydrolase family-domain-containing protein n=1 Tax=Glomus cerebriforme TaxID=658196 RepID=A0A397SXF6_9GLOM|nr:dienelactone hydrolase family-domain-containing protein [Glomus cerebriforme]
MRQNNFFNVIKRTNFQQTDCFKQKKINSFLQIRKLQIKPFELGINKNLVGNNIFKIENNHQNKTRKMNTKPDSEVSEGLPFKTLRFLPKNGQEKKNSAIIVLQEWWGINEQIKIHAQRIADNTNTLTITPDLYKGKLGLSQEEASHLMSNLDWKNALVELETLVDSLKNENRYKIGSIGFCMGGAVSLALASHLASKEPLSAVVTCYGIPSPTICDVSVIGLKTPVQGHFGNEDNMSGFSDPNAVNSLVRQLEEGIERMDETGKEISIYRYDGQGHAFLNDEEWALKMRKEQGFVGGDNNEIKALAWTRIYEFFNKYL